MTNKRNRQVPNLDINNFLPYLLASLAHKVSSRLSRIYQREYALSIPEWRILATLNQGTPLTSKDIATKAYMDKVKVSRAVQTLSKKRWIRKIMHAEDNRTYLVALSKKGQQVMDKITPIALNWQNQLLKTLSKSERETLFVVIDKLNGHFQ